MQFIMYFTNIHFLYKEYWYIKAAWLLGGFESMLPQIILVWPQFGEF